MQDSLDKEKRSSKKVSTTMERGEAGEEWNQMNLDEFCLEHIAQVALFFENEQRRRMQLEDIEAQTAVLNSMKSTYKRLADKDLNANRSRKVKAKRTRNRPAEWYILGPPDAAGVRHQIPYTSRDTWWYKMYVDPECSKQWRDAAPGDPKFRMKALFRLRFRVSWDFFSGLVDKVRADGWFSEQPNAVGTPSHPLELKILAVLRMLGRNSTFDCMQEATLIDKETLRSFFIKFVKNYASLIAPNVISCPQSEKELRDCEHEYKMAGFPGFVGSMDCTHTRLDRCDSDFSNLSKGKEKIPTRAFEIVVDHKRRILYVSRGFLGSTNDKTIVKFNSFVRMLRTNPLYKDFKYNMYVDGVLKEYQGARLLVDNGYLQYKELLPPYKQHPSDEAADWSEMAESLRKDVECTFGILKMRFAILKSGFRCHKFSTVDDIFKTCCALHNQLLEYDRMGSTWTVVGKRPERPADAAKVDAADFGLEEVPDVNEDGGRDGPAFLGDDFFGGATVPGVTDEDSFSDFSSCRLFCVKHFETVSRKHEYVWLKPSPRNPREGEPPYWGYRPPINSSESSSGESDSESNAD